MLVLGLLAACSTGTIQLDPIDSAVEGDADTDTDADSDADSDTDTDTDVEPEWFEPVNFYMTVYVGLDEDGLGNFGTTDNPEYPPLAIMYLVTEQYSVDQDPSEICAIYWSMTLQDTGGDRGWAEADAAYQGYWMSDPCYRLEPARFGVDPFQGLGVDRGSLAVGPLREPTLDALHKATDGSFPKPDDDSIFEGVVRYGDLDEVIASYGEYYPRAEFHYGYGYAADEDMVSDFSKLRTTRELEEGKNSVLVINSWGYTADWF